MSYELPVKTVTVEYDEYPGLEVELKVSPIPLAEFVEATKYVDELSEHFDTIDDMYALADFVERYVVRATYEAPFREWPHELLLGLAVFWRNGVGAVMPPLPRRSSATARFLAPSSDRETSTTPNSSTPSSSDTPATPSDPS